MRLLIILSVITLLSAAAFAQTAPLPSQFQSWNEVQLILPITRGKDAKGKSIDKLTATFNAVARLGRSSVDFVDNRAGAALDYRVNRYLTLVTGVLYRTDEVVKGIRRFETRLSAGAVFSKTFGNFTFRDRNLFEHRIRNGRNDIIVYRQRLQVSRPVKYNEKVIFTPFVSDEGYYDLQSKTWIQNEFLAGITRRINSRTAIDIAYVRNDTRPVNVNGISVNLKIKLR